jgi:hypothetical protein
MKKIDIDATPLLCFTILLSSNANAQNSLILIKPMDVASYPTDYKMLTNLQK